MTVRLSLRHLRTRKTQVSDCLQGYFFVVYSKGSNTQTRLSAVALDPSQQMTQNPIATEITPHVCPCAAARAESNRPLRARVSSLQ